MITKARRRAAGLAVALLPVLVAGLPGRPSFATPPGGDPTAAEVVNSLDVDSLPARYVVLVDRSASTSGDRFSTAVESVREIVGSMAAADHLTLIAFNDKLVQLFDGQVDEGASAAVDRLGALVPEHKTDIRAALAQAVETLESAPADQPANVLLITDGKEYGPSGFRRSGVWSQVCARGARLADQRVVNAYAVPMSDADGDKLLGQVFPGVITPELPPDQFAETLRRIKNRMGRHKASAYLTADNTRVRASVVGPIRITGRTASVPVLLTSESTYVPMSVDALGLTTGGLPLETTARPGPLILRPHQSTTVELTVRRTGWRHVGIGHPPEQDGALGVTAAVATPWHSAAAELDAPLKPTLVTEPQPASVVLGPAVPASYLVVGVLGASAIGLAWFLIARARRTALSGTLLIREPGMAEPYRLILRGGRGRMRFPPRRRSRSLTGGGSVVARQVRRTLGTGTEPELRIAYRHRRRRGRGSCRAGQTETILQTDFTYYDR